MSRRAPKQGYNFGAKRSYRRMVWSAVRSILGGLRGKSLLLMPSKEPDEIEVALRMGAEIHNVHALDMEPANVATVRRMYPELGGTYGCELSKLHERSTKRNQRFDAMNLDLCGPVSLSMLTDVANATKRLNARNTPSAYAVTALRGRGTWPKRLLDDAVMKDTDSCDGFNTMVEVADRSFVNANHLEPTRLDIIRLWCLLGVAQDHGGNLVALNRWGIYRSTAGSQSMIWAAFAVMNKWMWDIGLLRAAMRGQAMRWFDKGPINPKLTPWRVDMFLRAALAETDGGREVIWRELQDACDEMREAA